jgi:methionine biosynthesis protein MetW
VTADATSPKRQGQAFPGHENGRTQATRVDLLEIGRWVPPGSRVLDVGCGDGDLLYHLVHDRKVDARGIEISPEGVFECVSRGLSVIQGDADTDLANYPDDAFDIVILSQTLQTTRHPDEVMKQMLRIGRQAIVSFPNFGHWLMRIKLLFGGRMPNTPTLPTPWYATENIHFCTIADFADLCRERGHVIERFQALDWQGRPDTFGRSLRMANLMGEQGLFLLKRGN